MNWNQLLSTKRFGLEDFHTERKDDRTEFQRDYDRLIFSAPFRRLQNKTQVFPLPTNIFVHNRLTHSIEVACVGRSLGTNVALQTGLDTSEIGSIVSAACLAHDMGNPPFGHSGEQAISTYFSEGEGLLLREKWKIKEAEWNDFIHFEGNANAFRLLTHQFNGRRKGGFALTYSTVASIVKYPYSSSNTLKKSKFGFFQSENETFYRLTKELGIEKNAENRFARYPLTFLVEAADDICYQIMDIEDAHKLKILSSDETIALLLNFFDEERKNRRREVLKMVSDKNEQVAYLRSSVIGELVNECSRVFVENEKAILAGAFQNSLINCVSDVCRNAYRECSKTAVSRIYHSQEVIDIELAGYKIITTLLDHLTAAVFRPEKNYSQQLLQRIPQQYDTKNATAYGKIQAILDYISGMTDVYALDLYRKITGMSMPSL